jgi:hypothetical protein
MVGHPLHVGKAGKALRTSFRSWGICRAILSARNHHSYNPALVTIVGYIIRPRR